MIIISTFGTASFVFRLFRNHLRWKYALFSCSETSIRQPLNTFFIRFRENGWLVLSFPLQNTLTKCNYTFFADEFPQTGEEGSMKCVKRNLRCVKEIGLVLMRKGLFKQKATFYQ